MRRFNLSRDPRGQTLVIVGVGMVVLVGLVGLIIDVGLQWGDNRGSQNASDASAEAGAVVLMEYMLGATHDDDDVVDAVEDAAAAGGIEVDLAEYTDWQGTPFDPSIEVGGGGMIPTGAQGVRVIGTRVHQTVFARVLGINELSVFTDATAVSGPTEPCPPSSGPCALLPVTIPNTIVTCDGQNKSVATEDPWEGPPDGPEYILPLCGNNPGSVGWIDWTPPGGGVDELADQICDPNPIDLFFPDWYYVTSAGNVNSDDVQECFEQWIGSVILIPMFEDTCRTDPGDVDECTDPAPIGGVNQWYYFPEGAAIMLTGVYIQGNHADVCDTGNGATSCLTGTFVDTSIEGDPGEWIPGDPSLSQFFTVQLVD
jgi:Putative Flp pilus-assembly TadE/G-like